jgi:cell division protein FtsZ
VPVTDSITFKENQVSDRPARAELMARNKDRELKIKEFTLKLKTPNGLTEMENEPAYMRRKVSLENTQKSNESSVSRFTLSESVDENGEKRTELRDNNPFLHDNVD